MDKKYRTAIVTLLLTNTTTIMAGNINQDPNFFLLDSNLANITGATPAPSTTIDWRSLCLPGQLLTDSAGCTPDCERDANTACSTLFLKGQIENLTGIPRPYIRSGVVVFKLTQTANTGATALLNITLNQKPSGYGYMCEILNADATPATLWNTTHSSIPTTIITLDSNIIGPPFKSDSYATTATQPAGGVYYWYNNPNNPLYMVCLGYVTTDPNSLQSNVSCGGTGPVCVSYTLQ